MHFILLQKTCNEEAHFHAVNGSVLMWREKSER